MRLKLLHALDDALYWGLSKRQKPLPFTSEEEGLGMPLAACVAFAEEHGYFSPNKPLVGEVSADPQDVKTTEALLAELCKTQREGNYLPFAAAEILTKVLAYRDLVPGTSLALPVIERGAPLRKEPYIVDELFNIWHGMPAFGLLPVHPGVPALLLFRGTDFSLSSERGLASILSDLDLSGPGAHAFAHAQPQLHRWLLKAHTQGKAACVMGFSLGGALACLTFLAERPLLSTKHPSWALSAPGLAQPLTTAHDNQFIRYIHADDLVSRVGHLSHTVYCASSGSPLRPLTAHTALLSAEPHIHIVKMNAPIV